MQPRLFERTAIVSEIGATLAVAAPLAAANLAQMAMAVTDTIMVGRLGGVPLAAAGLGAALYFTIVVLVQGIVSAVAPLAASAIGAGDHDAAGRIAGGGIALAVLISVPLVAAMMVLDRLLLASGYDPELAVEVGRFLRAVAWGAPAFIAFGALRSFLAAATRPGAVMAVVVLCIPVNAVLNWILIFGHLGMPEFGIAGSGYASAINQWLMAGGLAAYILAAPGLARYRVFGSMVPSGLREIKGILALGLPIGGLMGTEIGVFVTASVLMGLLGAAALGAHQIVLNIASVTFMVPLGIGQAATVRIAAALGAGARDAARRAGVVAMALGIVFMGAAAIVLWSAPEAIIGVYVDLDDPANREMIAIAVRLCAIAALFQVFDGIQTIAAGALRGYEDTAVPMVLAGIGYWAIGFVVGAGLAIPLGHGAVGFWCGLALGLASVSILLSARLYWRAHATS